MHVFGELTVPNFMFSYISAILDVAPHLSSEQLDTFKDKTSYNEDAKELCDRMVEGIQAGKNLIKVHEKFNHEMIEFELVLDGDELGRAVGEDELNGATEGEGSGGAEEGGAEVGGS